MYCLRAFHGLVIELVRAAWLRYVRRLNGAALGDTADLSAFLFGAERGDLSRQAQVVREIDGSRCFYCHSSLGKSADVDHFIPWARYPVDLGHNFVLAHSGCNRAKSDGLASVEHLAHWCERNDANGMALASAFDIVGVTHDLRASKKVAEWAYAQAETSGSDVWLEGARTTQLDGGWKELLQSNWDGATSASLHAPREAN